MKAYMNSAKSDSSNCLEIKSAQDLLNARCSSKKFIDPKSGK